MNLPAEQSPELRQAVERVQQTQGKRYLEPLVKAQADFDATLDAALRLAAVEGVVGELQHTHGDGCVAPRQADHPRCRWCKKLAAAEAELAAARAACEAQDGE